MRPCFIVGTAYKIDFKEKVFPFKKRNNLLLCVKGPYHTKDKKVVYDFMVLRHHKIRNKLRSTKTYHLFDQDFDEIKSAEKSNVPLTLMP